RLGPSAARREAADYFLPRPLGLPGGRGPRALFLSSILPRGRPRGRPRAYLRGRPLPPCGAASGPAGVPAERKRRTRKCRGQGSRWLPLRKTMALGVAGLLAPEGLG